MGNYYRNRSRHYILGYNRASDKFKKIKNSSVKGLIFIFKNYQKRDFEIRMLVKEAEQRDAKIFDYISYRFKRNGRLYRNRFRKCGMKKYEIFKASRY